MMLYQYTAAALASENKVLAHPASVDSIPTSANQEDHVSMGSIAARHARTVLEHVERIVGIELVVAAQALDLRIAAGPRGVAPGAGVAEALARVRSRIAHLDHDREPGPDLARVLRPRPRRRSRRPRLRVDSGPWPRSASSTSPTAKASPMCRGVPIPGSTIARATTGRTPTGARRRPVSRGSRRRPARSPAPPEPEVPFNPFASSGAHGRHSTRSPRATTTIRWPTTRSPRVPGSARECPPTHRGSLPSWPAVSRSSGATRRSSSSTRRLLPTPSSVRSPPTHGRPGCATSTRSSRPRRSRR